MIKICLDPGHGGKDSGAVYNSLQEKDIVLKVVQRVRTILMACKYIESILTRDADVFIPLEDRVKIANDNNVDYFLSIHCNADADDDTDPAKEAKGEEIWVCKNSVLSRNYAEILRDWVDMLFEDEPFRGIKESPGLYVLKYTNMPANLIELGFIDSSSTNRKFSNDKVINDISICLALGILNVAHEIYKRKYIK